MWYRYIDFGPLVMLFAEAQMTPIEIALCILIGFPLLLIVAVILTNIVMDLVEYADGLIQDAYEWIGDGFNAVSDWFKGKKK